MNRQKSNLVKSQIVIHAKHDQVFRKALETPIVAREFINAHAPEELLKIINLDSLRLEKDSYISLALNNSTSDSLFSVNFKQREGKAFLLIEHQSSVDRFIVYRILKYKTDIWDRYRTIHPKTKHLPLIYSILVYNGTRHYNAPLNSWQLNDIPELAKEYQDEGYKLVNVHNIPDNELKNRIWSGTLEYFLKHIRAPRLLEKWEEIIGILPDIAKESNGIDYLQLLLNYTLTAINEDDIYVLVSLSRVKRLSYEKA